MSTAVGMLVIIGGGILIGLITGLSVRKNGYSFKGYFVGGFLMGAGILGIILKIISDYI